MFAKVGRGQIDPSFEPRPATSELLEEFESAHLPRIEALIRNGGYDEAIEVIRTLVRSEGAKLIKIERIPGDGPAGFERYVPMREFGLSQLARLSQLAPEALRGYREQLEGQASKFGSAPTVADESNLRRLVDSEQVLSSVGDEALLRLGDMLFERGDHAGARELWERIDVALRFPMTTEARLRSAAGRPLWFSFRGVDARDAWSSLARLVQPASESAVPERFTYPGTNLDLAEVRARLILASIFEGNFERAEIEMALFRAIHPDAQGHIAARQGKLAEILQAIFVEARKWPAIPAETDWSTFAGSPSRQRTSPWTLENAAKPLWRVELPRRSARQETLSINRVRVAESTEGLLSFHPLILGRQVIVQTGPDRHDVASYDRETGTRIFPVERSGVAEPAPDVTRGVLGVNRFTLAALGSRLLVRTGNPWLLSPATRSPIAFPAKLEAIDLAAEGRLLWALNMASPVWGEEWVLSGAPVTDGSRLYVAACRRSALRIETHIAALDPDDGRLIWRTFVSAAEPAMTDTMSLIANGLLTLSHGELYCNTNNGAVAALRTSDGGIRWVSTYARTSFNNTDPDRNDLHFYRDLNPCVVFQDLLFVAPSDCNRIFALDRATGMVIWATRAGLAADAIHLLGISGKNLIVSGECLYWFDMFTGELVGQFPEPFFAPPGFARPSPRGYGRGILAGGHVYWPTHDALLVFESQTIRTERGWQPVSTGRLALPGTTGGNLAAASGILLIAGAEHLTAYRISEKTEP